MNPPRTETPARSRSVRESVQTENCVSVSLSRLETWTNFRRPLKDTPGVEVDAIRKLGKNDPFFQPN